MCNTICIAGETADWSCAVAVLRETWRFDCCLRGSQRPVFSCLHNQASHGRGRDGGGGVEGGRLRGGKRGEAWAQRNDWRIPGLSDIPTGETHWPWLLHGVHLPPPRYDSICKDPIFIACPLSPAAMSICIFSVHYHYRMLLYFTNNVNLYLCAIESNYLNGYNTLYFRKDYDFKLHYFLSRLLPCISNHSIVMVAIWINRNLLNQKSL